MKSSRNLIVACAAILQVLVVSPNLSQSTTAATVMFQQGAKMVDAFEFIVKDLSNTLPAITARLRPGERANDVTTFLYVNAVTRLRFPFMIWDDKTKSIIVTQVRGEADFWSFGDPWKPRPLADKLAMIRRPFLENLYTRIRITLVVNPGADLKNFAFIPQTTSQYDSVVLLKNARQNLSFYNDVFPFDIIERLYNK